MHSRQWISALALLVGASGSAWAAEAAKKTTKPAASAKAAPQVNRTAAAARPAAKPQPKAAAAGVAAASLATAATGTAAQNGLDVKSSAALVVDVSDGKVLYAKNTDHVSSIASITKLMTAIVVLDAALPLDESIRIDRADIDTLKHTGSRLRIGAVFNRRDLLHLALMSSENRAASALGRAYPGGTEAFVARMNARALELGMFKSRFAEPTGLSSENVSTADDLVHLVRASLDYPLIREFSTAPSAQVQTVDTGQVYGFGNSNGLVRTPSWQIDVSKTGYIAEAGQCLVMHARIKDRPVTIVLLDSWGKYTRIGDANRIKQWLERAPAVVAHAS